MDLPVALMADSVGEGRETQYNCSREHQESVLVAL